MPDQEVALFVTAGSPQAVQHGGGTRHASAARPRPRDRVAQMSPTRATRSPSNARLRPQYALESRCSDFLVRNDGSNHDRVLPYRLTAPIRDAVTLFCA